MSLNITLDRQELGELEELMREVEGASVSFEATIVPMADVATLGVGDYVCQKALPWLRDDLLPFLEKAEKVVCKLKWLPYFGKACDVLKLASKGVKALVEALESFC